MSTPDDVRRVGYKLSTNEIFLPGISFPEIFLLFMCLRFMALPVDRYLWYLLGTNGSAYGFGLQLSIVFSNLWTQSTKQASTESTPVGVPIKLKRASISGLSSSNTFF